MATIAVFRSSMMKPSLCRFASTVNSAIFQKYGNPANVVRLQKTSIGEVTDKDVEIRMVAAPVTSFDMDMIYGRNPTNVIFPAVAGSEGVGIVEKMGKGVTGACKEDAVMFIKPFKGTWSERMVVSEENIIPVPQGISAEIASVMLNTAGIAYRLLNDFTQLKAGDVVLQNDACCPVGLAVIQLCKKRGIKTINIVKDRADVSRLEALGADVIVKESQVNGVDFKKMLADLPAPTMALDGCGGDVMTNTCRLMKNGTVVTYNESSHLPFQLSANQLMNGKLCLKGFNMNAWLSRAAKVDVAQMVQDLAVMIRAEELRLSVQTSKFSQVSNMMASATCCCAPVDGVSVMMMDQ